MPDHSADEQFLRQALDLARQGFGLASPNPYVGTLIIDRTGNVAGTGVYTYDGVKHAEVWALEQAGNKARGERSTSISNRTRTRGERRPAPTL